MTDRTHSAASTVGTDATRGAGVDHEDADGDSEEPIRYETEDGTDYVVINTVVQREGVYKYKTNSGTSREYVDGEELTGDDVIDEWDGVDVTLRHPVVVNNDGEAAYGLTRDPTARYTSVGEFREGGSTDEALKGELWVEEDEVGNYDGDLEDYIEGIEEDGEIGEVSSGYGPGAVVNDRGTYNGEPYEVAQKSLNPDHVAILPDEPGNCSVADGCGAGRTNAADGEAAGSLVRANGIPVTDGGVPEPEPRVNIRADARTPEYSGAVPASQTEDEFLYWGLEDYLDAYVEETGEEYTGDPHSALSSIPEGSAEWIAEHTLLGSADAETEENLLTFAVVGPDGQLYEEKLLDVLGPAGSRPTIPEEQRESARDVAEELLEEAFGGLGSRTNADTSRLRKAWRDLVSAVRINDADSGAGDQPDDPDESGEVSGSGAPSGSGSGSGEQSPNEPAESGADADTDNMNEYESKTDELVEEHGFDAENLPGEDEECFSRIYDKFAGEGSDGAQTETETEETDVDSEETDVETTETTESPESPDGVEADAEGEEIKVNKDELAEIVDERVEDRLESKETQRQREEHERAIVNSEAPFDEEDLEPMNADAVANIHEKYVGGEAQTQTGSTGRANFAGRPSPETTSRANSGEAATAPVGGVKNAESRTNADTSGDDE